MPADTEVIDLTDSDDEDDQSDPTPIVQRLRSRTRSSVIREPSSELEADGEEESEIDGLSEASPRLSRQSRSQTKIDSMEDEPMELPSRRSSRSLPARGAKQKAIEALKGGESEEEAMDLDDLAAVEEFDMGEEMDEDEAPPSGRLTRSQHRARADGLVADQGSSDDDDADTSRERITPSLTPLSPIANGHTDQGEIEVEHGDAERQTRSGKAFGSWQNRRSRLRQEAMDDPDMELDEDTDEDGDDDSFEPGQFFTLRASTS